MTLDFLKRPFVVAGLLSLGAFAFQIINCSSPLMTEDITGRDDIDTIVIVIADTIYSTDTVFIGADTIYVPGDTVFIPGDTIYLPGDTVFVPNDTVYLPGDTVFVPGDTVYVPPDTVFLPGDTVFVPGDTVFLPPDTIYVPLDTVYVPGDTIFLPGDTIYVPLDTIYLPGDTVYLPSDTVIVHDTLLQYCNRLEASAQEIVWPLMNEAGRYLLEFAAVQESSQPPQILNITIDGHLLEWALADSLEFRFEGDIGANAVVRIAVAPPPARGHAIDICMRVTRL
jgi:Tfp pilus assembly protein PilZ